MGVKCTVTLSRSEAEKRFAKFYAKADEAQMEEQIEEEMPDLSDFHLPYHLRDLEITSDQIADVYVAVELRKRSIDLRKEARRLVIDMNDTQLENELERVHDLAKGGEGFENYIIQAESADED